MKTYNVTYTKAKGLKGIIMVKARNQKEALSNAKNCCFTGSNFRDAVETNKPYIKPSKMGFQGSNRMN